MPRSLATILSVAAACVASSRPAGAEPDEPSSVMGALAARGLHDPADPDGEAWSVYGQETTIYNHKPGFAAPYTNLGGSNHSLSAAAEGSYSLTLTLFAGLRPWRGAELFLVPELLGEVPLSNLAGLGGAIQNAELQKTGAAYPLPYLSRSFLRQTIDLGGARVALPSRAMQLGQPVTRHRLVLTAGNFSILDVMDKNAYAGDLRRQFMNMSFMTSAAFDFAADARGYAWGATAELYWDAWALRVGRLTPPKLPNQLPLDFDLWHHHGDQVEVAHDHVLGGQPGAARLLGFRNREVMGRFDEAIAALEADPGRSAAACQAFSYGSTNATAPDLCWARRSQVKVGVGVNLEQAVAPDLGLFLRAMYADGKTEVYSFMSSDRSLALGALGTGARWGRPRDAVGLAYGQGWISDAHAAYLARGGVDGFLGDGALTHASEIVAEGYYAAGVTSWLWLTADYQEIWHPGYNGARGPVSVLTGRLHAEF